MDILWHCHPKCKQCPWVLIICHLIFLIKPKSSQNLTDFKTVLHNKLFFTVWALLAGWPGWILRHLYFFLGTLRAATDYIWPSERSPSFPYILECLECWQLATQLETRLWCDRLPISLWPVMLWDTFSIFTFLCSRSRLSNLQLEPHSWPPPMFLYLKTFYHAKARSSLSAMVVTDEEMSASDPKQN